MTNAQSGDSINFSVSGTINLAADLPAITKNLSIQGPGADKLTVNLSPVIGSVFAVDSGATATISALTITSGFGFGGGVDNLGTLTLNKDTISGNGSLTGQNGGGIANSGALTVTSCTISGNNANKDQYNSGGLGGGIYNHGTLTLNNSTVANNGAYIGGAIYNDTAATLAMNSDTVSGNSALADAGIVGYGSVSMRNTIDAGNAGDFGGSVVTSDHNLMGGNPKLGPLQYNGGPTQTMALLAGSLAIDRGDNSGAPSRDQRGFTRSQVDGLIDIGAFEYQPAHKVVNDTTLTASASSSVAGQSVTFTASVAALLQPNSYPTPTGTVTFTVDGASPTKVTLSAGQASITLALTKAGTHTIVATYSGDNSYARSTSAPVTLTVTPGAATQLAISAPASVTAGTAFVVTVTALDAYGNVATGYTGTVHFTSSDRTATLPADYTFTASESGVHTFKITLARTGTQSITATDTLTSSITATASGISVGDGGGGGG
jgi:hypothetical protein